MYPDLLDEALLRAGSFDLVISYSFLAMVSVGTCSLKPSYLSMTINLDSEEV